MKKALFLILALVLCLFLCACGEKSNSSDQSDAINIFAGDSVVDEIKEQLIGEWYYENKPTSNGIPRYLIAEFNEDGYFSILIVHAYDNGHKVDGTISGILTCEEYERYCKEHPEFRNGVTTDTIKVIHEEYMRLWKTHAFSD